MSVLLKNWRMMVFAVLAFLFSVIVISGSNANQFQVRFPAENSDFSGISFAGRELSADGEAFSFSYAGWDVEQLGLRFFGEGGAEKHLSVKIVDSGNNVYSHDFLWGDLITDEEGITWIPIGAPVHAGMLFLYLSTDSEEPISVCVYTQEGMYGEDGNPIVNLQAQVNAAPYPKRNAYLFSLLSILLITSLFLFVKEKGISYERLFLCFYLLLGVLAFCIFPPFAEPDSGNHYRRAFSVSEGSFFPELDENHEIADYFAWPETWGTDDAVSVSRYEAKNRMDFRIYEKSAKQYLSYKNIALYSPVSHAVPAVAMRLARFFTDKLMAMVLAARILNFLAVGFLLFLAVRITPFGKKYIFWVILMPFMMKLYTSISPDAMTAALVLLLTAMVFRLRYDGEAIVNRKWLSALYAVSFLLGQFKIVYIVFCLFLFLIPPEKFGNRKRYFFHVFGIGAITLLPALGWFAISSHILREGYAIKSAVNSAILLNPFRFLPILARTFVQKGHEYIQEFFGYTLGIHEGVNETIFYINIAYILFLVGKHAAQRQDNHFKPGICPRTDRPLKIWFCLCMGLVIFLIFGAEYVQWTEPAAIIIDGVRGRYFFPLLFPALSLLCGISGKKGAGETVAKEEALELFHLSLLAVCFFSWLFMGYYFF